MRLRAWSLAGAGCLLLPAAFAVADDAPPALVGRWQLNDKESESPQAKFRALRPGEDPNKPDAEADAGRQSDPRARQRASQRKTGEPPAKLEAPPGLAEFLEAPRTLVIATATNEVTLGDDKGAELRLALDGAERKDGSLVTSARLEGQSLVIEKKNEAGARLTTRLSLMPGGKKLEVYQRLAGTQGRAVTLRRVYDAEKKEEAS